MKGRNPTREAWLVKLVDKLGPLFEAQGHTIPEIHVSCGWPSAGGLGTRKKTIGQCWSPKASEDDKPHIFISPVLGCPMEVAAVMVHEVVHAVVGTECGHKGPFRKLAKAVGLVGKMTETNAGEGLAADLEKIVLALPAYPHAALNPKLSGVKKQGTRMLKVICEDCGYTVRTTQKWIDVGLPTCPCGTGMEEAV